MKGLLCCLLLLPMQLAAQPHVAFRLLAHGTFDSFAQPVIKEYFGGISAIDRFVPQEKELFPNAPEGTAFLMASDHHKVRGKSFFFFADRNCRVLGLDSLSGMDQVEALRFDPQKKAFLWTYEQDKATGLILSGKKSISQTLLEEEISGPYTSANRGMEGLALSPGRRLWLSFEAGGDTVCDAGSIPFYRLSLPDPSGEFSLSGRQVFHYPFERCACMTPGQHFDGRLGNGVTELIALDDTCLLVLERCYNGIKAYVRLYLGTIDTASKTVRKEQVFDFNDEDLTVQYPGFAPDNLEGMSLYEENGTTVLYLVSDNNFNPKQKNQWVKLEMVYQ